MIGGGSGDVPASGSVLLVEDDESLRSAYRLVLEARSLDVREATTLGEAEAILRSGPVDVVVADLGLPDADGPAAVAASLGEQARESALVVLTGHDDASLRNRCREAGAAAFRVKPLVGSELADLVRELLPDSTG